MQSLRLQVQAILQQHTTAKQVIIFPPSLDWNTQLFQRPQQLALALARQGALVFYLQLHPSETEPPFRQIEPRLFLCHVPVETFAEQIEPVLYLLTWNLSFAASFHSPWILYDYVDELDVFPGDPHELRREHEKMVRQAGQVLATAERLYRQVLPLRSDAMLCPNGVDYPHFASLRRPPEGSPPGDLQAILDRGKPVVGYYGALAIWFDYGLLASVARLRPDFCFVLIGPDDDGTLPPGLLDLSNVFWLGVKAYQDLPRYLRYFDIATIPFKLGPVTHSTSPLKLFEYLAAGKPVIITPMQESMRYAGILVAGDSAEFSRLMDEALKLKDDPAYLQLSDEIARQNTWEARASQILAALPARQPQP